MRLLLLLGNLILAGSGFASANPAGGVVTSGSAAISTSPGTVTINQSSNTAIINWQTFSIQSGQLTKFIQPSSTSAVLNRVTGGQSSLINGTLSANGQVYLINGNGILVGQHGRINTGAFTASTRDIADSDFLSGDQHYTGTASAGVENQGSIKALDGDVILIGQNVSNTGTINARRGTVGLAAGDDVYIAQAGQQHVFVHANPSASAPIGGTGISNTGTIAAARAELRAADGNIYALAINNGGTIRAGTVTHQGGDIYLTADDGVVENSGQLDASATAARGAGGQVLLQTAGQAVDTGSIVAQGGAGGTGGNAEISGHDGVDFSGKVDLTAQGGHVGDLLLDPATLTVQDGGSTTDLTASVVDPTAVENALSTADVTLNADNAITIADAITWTSANMLELTTNVDGSTIKINAPITGLSGGFSITTSAGDMITPTAAVNVGTFLLNRGFWQQIAGENGVPSTLPAFSATQDFEMMGLRTTFERLAGGDGSSANPFQITDIYGLQGLASPSHFFYANSGNNYNFVLNNNIDASVTKNWRGGDGFAPIGDIDGPSSIGGTFDGANFAINNLYEHYDGNSTPETANDSENVGLFSNLVTGSIVNLNLTNIDFAMTNDTFGFLGGIVSYSSGTLTNDSVTGTITGLVGPAAGGLIGEARDGTITQCNASVNISASIYGTGSAIGGLIGDNEAQVNNSYSLGNVTVLSQTMTGAVGASGPGIGGFVGYMGENGGVTNGYSTGNVTVNALGVVTGFTLVPVGGFVGSAEDCQIQNSYSIGVVSETDSAGTDPSLGIYAGDIDGNQVAGYGRTDNQTSVGVLVGTGNNNNIDPATGGMIQTPSTINFIDGVTWFQATSLTGPTKGFPTLTGPAAAGDTVTISLSDNLGATATYGQSLVLTGTLADTTNTGTIVTGGTLSFDENGTLILAPVTVTGDTVTLDVPTLNASTTAYDFTASYSGTSSFAAATTASPLTLTIGQKALIVTAGATTKTYGSTTLDSGQQFTATGLIGSDSVTRVTFASPGLAATATVNGGASYNLTASDAVGTGLTNYSITYQPGTLTVNPAVLTLTALNQTVLMNGSINTTPTLGTTFSVTGLQNGQQVGSVLTGNGVSLSSTQSTANAGSFPGVIVIDGQLNTSLGANYTLTKVNGNLTVKSTLADSTTISLSSNLGSSTTYGQALILTATLNDTTTPGTTVMGGTVSFDENGTIILTPVTVTGDTVTLDVPSLLNASGTAYDFTASYSGVSQSFASSSTTAPLTLTVGQKALVITAGNATKIYGSTSLTYSGQQFTATGLVAGTADSVTNVTLTSAGQAATADVDGGTPYALAASGAIGTGLSNYSITYANGALTVTPAALTITAGAATKTYGSTVLTFPGAQFTTSGLVNSDTVAGVTLASTGQAATAGVNGGNPYTLTAGTATGTGLANYTITYANGSLTVDPALLTIAALNQTVPFEGTLDTAATLGTTYSVTGLQNGDLLGDVLAAGPSLSTSQNTIVPGDHAGAIVVAASLDTGAGANYSLTLVNGDAIVENPPTSVLSEAQEQQFNQFSVAGTDDTLNPATDDGVLTVQPTGGQVRADVAREKLPPGATKGSEQYFGMDVMDHASSFTVGKR